MKKMMSKITSLALALCMLISLVPAISAEPETEPAEATQVTVSVKDTVFTGSAWTGYEDSIVIDASTTVTRKNWVTVKNSAGSSVGGYRIPSASKAESKNVFSVNVKAVEGMYSVYVTPVKSGRGCSYTVTVDGINAGRIDTRDTSLGNGDYVVADTVLLDTVSVTPDENGWVNITFENVSERSELVDGYNDTIGFTEISLVPFKVVLYDGITETISDLELCEADVRSFVVKAKMDDGSFKVFDPTDTSKNNMTAAVTSGSSVELSNLELKADGLHGKIEGLLEGETSTITITTTIDGEPHNEMIEVTPLVKRVAAVTTVSMSDKIFSSSGANLTSLPPDKYYWNGYQDIVEILPDETTIDRISWITGYKIPAANVAAGKRVFAFKVRLVPGPYAIDLTPVMSGRGTTFNVIVDGKFAGSVATRNKDLSGSTYETVKAKKLNSLDLTGEEGWVTVRLEVTSTRAECYDGYNDTIGMGAITFTPLAAPVSVTGISENITGAKVFTGKALDFVISPILSDGSPRTFAENDEENKIVASVEGTSVALSDMAMKSDGLHGKLTGISPEESTIKIAVTINGTTTNHEIDVTPIPVYSYSMLASGLTTSGIDSEGTITDTDSYTISWNDNDAVFVKEESSITSFREVSVGEDAFAFPAGNYASAQFTFKAKVPADGYYAVSINPLLSQLGGRYGVWVNGEYAGSVNSWNGIEGIENWTETVAAGDEVSLNTINLTSDEDGYVKVTLKNLSTASDTTIADSYKDADCTPIAFSELKLTPTEEVPAYDGIFHNIEETLNEGETRDFVVRTKMDDGSFKYFDPDDTSKNNITATAVEGSSVKLSDVVLKDDGLYGKITALKGDDKAIITVISKIDGVEYKEKIWVTMPEKPVAVATSVSMNDKIFSASGANIPLLSPEKYYWIDYQDIVEILPDETTINRINWINNYRIPSANIAERRTVFAFKVKLVPGPYAIELTPVMSGRGTTFNVIVDGQLAGSVATRDTDIGVNDYQTGEKQKLSSLNLTGNDGWVTVKLEVTSTRAECADGYNDTIGMGAISFIPLDKPISVVGLKDITETSVFKDGTFDFVISPIMSDGSPRYFLADDERNTITVSVADGSSVTLSDMVMKEDGLHGKITGVRSGEEAILNVNVTVDGVSNPIEVPVTPIDLPTFESTEISLEPLLLVGDELTLDVVAKYSDGSIASAKDIVNVFRSDSDKVEIEGNKLIVKAEGNARILVTTTLKGTEKSIDGYIDVSIIAEGIKSVSLSAGGSRYIRLTDKENDTVPMYITALTNLGNEVDITGAEVTYEALNPELAEVTVDGTIYPRAVGDATFRATLVYEGKTFSLSDTLKVVWGKDSSALITDEMRENAAENIKTYDWAESSVSNLLKNADKYVPLLDELYDMFPSEGLPRAFAIGYPGDPYAYTCQYCNTNLEAEYGSYSWVADPLKDKWKIKCPACSRSFPSNDFGSFYKLGLNDYGEFDRTRALERHRELFIDKITELYPNVTEPGEDHSESWYQYYGYGIPGGYLTNTLYPEVGSEGATAFKGRFDPEIETTERWSVDDGYGYFPGRIWDENKGIEEHYGYIAVYIHAGLFRANTGGKGTLHLAISDLADAYSYTGDPKYGRPAAILLDRLADLYPGFDFNQWHPRYNSSQGGTGQGKIIGSIWANQDAAYAKAYDYVYDMYDDPYVLEYIQNKGKTLKFRHAKETPSQLRTNIEDGILREIFEAVKTRRICGNFGFPQSTLATTAAAMNALPDTQEMIDYLMAPGFSEHPVAGQHVNEMDGLGYHTEILATVDYDGQGEEASWYNYNHFTSIYSVQKTLEKITIYDGADLFENFPRFRKMAYAFFPLTMSDYTANMGDSGQTINNKLVMTSDLAIQLYRRLGDVRFAQYAYMANGNSVKGIREDIYTKNPEAIQKDIQAVIDEYGEFTAENEMLGGYGFGTIKDGVVYRDVTSSTKIDNRRGLWMYWGMNYLHGHNYSLNIGIDGFGLDMTPDLGYPPNTEYTSENRHWVRVTLSHNTVQVDDDFQDNSKVRGKTMHFDDSDVVKLMDVDAKNAYAQTDAYRRSVVMVNIDDDNSYYVDFFRVKGGNSHEYSFHAQSDTIAETAGLDLVDMSEYGSYANVWNMEKTGEQVEEEYLRKGVGDDPYTDTTSGKRYKTKYPVSYTWLENVQRASDPKDIFAVDWNVKDFAKRMNVDGTGLHLRATMFGMDDGIESKIAIADGYPPQKAANKDVPKLKYLLVKREGENLDTLFSTVYEPYKNERTLENIEELSLAIKSGAQEGLDTARAVKVTHAGGDRIDYIFYATNNDVIYTLDDNGLVLDFRGFVGVYTIQKDANGEFKNTCRYVNDGDVIGGASPVKSSIEGQIASFTTEHAFENEITMLMIDPISSEEAEKLAGRYIFVENDGKLNASYKIQSAEVVGDKLKLDIGDLSLIRGLVNDLDLDGGYVYNISKWDNCRIPLSYEEENVPVFAPVSDGVVSVDSMYTQVVSASGQNGTQVKIVGRDLPRGASFDSETNTFKWKPTMTQIGANHVSLTATDEFGRETTVHFIVDVYGSVSGGGGGDTPSTDKPDEPDEPTVEPDEPKVEPDEPGTDEPTEGGDVAVADGFVDLGNHAWATDAINYLADEGIIKGTSETTFSPASNITRADYAILLVRAFKLESENAENFADVDESDYFAEELAVARNTGIVGGIGDNKYAPRNTITRQDMMVILYRALVKMGIE
ncbi:MAG: S-layer homology domain-containing protein, partial [Oscillospiraceae bacterium]|nr:S-layer homology domain-containing protein [Oscillospiraceae bacterium]